MSREVSRRGLWEVSAGGPEGGRSLGEVSGRSLGISGMSLGEVSGRGLWEMSLGDRWARSLGEVSGRDLWERSVGEVSGEGRVLSF